MWPTPPRAGLPVITVLGNHDWHVDRVGELIRVLEDGGIVVLERGHHIVDIGDVEVGIAGAKGFVGGFPGSHLPDFGEPSLREVYRREQAEVDALDAGLQAVALCPLRIALLHYAPTARRWWASASRSWPSSAPTGWRRRSASTSRLVLHGHAHAGTFEGRIGDVPVYNVSVPVLGEDWWIFELAGERRAPSEVR